jgi:hypothetical protein
VEDDIQCLKHCYDDVPSQQLQGRLQKPQCGYGDYVKDKHKQAPEEERTLTQKSKQTKQR